MILLLLGLVVLAAAWIAVAATVAGVCASAADGDRALRQATAGSAGRRVRRCRVGARGARFAARA